MSLKPQWHKLTSNWKTYLGKSLPYVLAAVFVSVTVFAVMAAQGVSISVEGTRGEYEAEKQTLEANRQEIAKALAETQKLLDQLNSINSDTQDLLQEAERHEDAVSDKIQQLEGVLENVQNQEYQRWVLPIRYTVITSRFGYREHPVDGNARFHYGVDMAANQGTPIVASRSGTVLKATYGDNEGYYVKLDHLDGYVSGYLHMAKYIVQPGQFVMAGQIIGYCGSSGVSTGPHLHFEITLNGDAVDPGQFLDIY